MSTCNSSTWFTDKADDGPESRTAAVTADVLAEYKELINDTTSDLEDHLQAIDRRLQDNSTRTPATSNKTVDECDVIREERHSTQQCLRICDWVSGHIDQVQRSTFEGIYTASGRRRVSVSTPRDYVPARRVTTDVFKECKERLIRTTSELSNHLDEIDSRLQHSSRGARSSTDYAAEQSRIQEERDSIKNCLSICAEASEQVDSGRTNVFEDVSAAPDAHQMVVATFGDLISARRVNAGARSTQWLGQMSDSTLEQLSRDNNRFATEKAASRSNATVRDFEDRYGIGKKLDSSCLTERRLSLPAEKTG